MAESLRSFSNCCRWAEVEPLLAQAVTEMTTATPTIQHPRGMCTAAVSSYVRADRLTHGARPRAIILRVSDDAVLAALDDLVAVGRSNIVAWIGVMSRVDEVRALRSSGTAYKDMTLSDGVSIAEAIATNQEKLTAAAAKFRRATARQLHNEGMTPSAIARAFGVTRQRVAALLTDEPQEPDVTTVVDR